MPLTGAASEVPPRKVDPAILKTDRLVTKTFTKNTFGCVRLFLIPLSHCHDLPDDCFFSVIAQDVSPQQCGRTPSICQREVVRKI